MPVKRKKRVTHRSHRKRMLAFRQSSRKEAALKSLSSPTVNWASIERERKQGNKGHKKKRKEIFVLFSLILGSKRRKIRGVYLSLKQSFSNLTRPLNHMGNFIKIHILILMAPAQAQDFAFLTFSQMMVMALGLRPHFEEQGSCVPTNGILLSSPY